MKKRFAKLCALFLAAGLAAGTFGARAYAYDPLTVVIDPGHDNAYHGAQYFGLAEEERNLAIARACREVFKKYPYVRVIMTRNSMENPFPGRNHSGNLHGRSSVAKKNHADIFVSLHLNADPNPARNGAMVLIQNRNWRPEVGKESAALGNEILKQLISLGLTNHGLVRRDSASGGTYPDGSPSDYYTLLNDTKRYNIPGVIVEHAFLSSKTDVDTYISGDKAKALGEADAKGILSYLGIKGGEDSLIFCSDYYLEKNPQLEGIFGDDQAALYENYYQYGAALGRASSPVFDIAYYKQMNPDVTKCYGKDTWGIVTHFLDYGIHEGRASSPDFDWKSYALANPDLRRAFGYGDKADYYDHYINYGRREGRTATGVTERVGAITALPGTADYAAVYDCDYYLEKYPDLRAAFGNDDILALQHFMKYGMKEGRQASPAFDAKYYREAYPDLNAAFGDNWAAYYQHYLKYGKAEGRVAVRPAEETETAGDTETADTAKTAETAGSAETAESTETAEDTETTSTTELSE